MMYLSKISFSMLLFFYFCTGVLAQSPDINPGIQLYNAKKLSEAKEFFLQFKKDHPQHPTSCYYLGRIFLQLRDYKQAEKWFKEATELDSTNSNYHLWLARTYGLRAQRANIFKKLSLAKKSKKYFELAVELDDKNVEARQGLILYLLNAPGIAGGDLRKALEQAQILVKMDEPRGRALLARIYEKKKDMHLAEEQYRRLEQLYGDSTEHFSFYNQYGYFLLKQKRYEEAIAKFQKQVELAPEEANPYDSLGDGYRAAGRLKEAADAYHKALQIDPEFEPSKKKLKEVLRKLKSEKS